MQTNVASIDWLGGKQASRVDSSSQVAAHAYHPSHSFDAAGTAMDSAPSCRPWERGDLLRRLATFKPSTWASKPKVSSLVGTTRVYGTCVISHALGFLLCCVACTIYCSFGLLYTTK
jgi:hypothetical protein